MMVGTNMVFHQVQLNLLLSFLRRRNINVCHQINLDCMYTSLLGGIVSFKSEVLHCGPILYTRFIALVFFFNIKSKTSLTIIIAFLRNYLMCDCDNYCVSVYVFVLNRDRGYKQLWAKQTFRLFIILATVISRRKNQ